MQVISSKNELRKEIEYAKKAGGKIVFVPTMGALHAGHYALMEKARLLAGEKGRVVVSIFVNPIQFNNEGDLAHYPRTLEEDLAGCEKVGVDMVFTPEVHEVYAPNRSIDIQEKALSQYLCGASRPGHFSGVCTVVTKLLNLVQPTDAIFGKKDYQQLAIIRRLVRDLDLPVRIHGAEIVRLPSGLAYSSRNERLSKELKQEAVILSQALKAAHQDFLAGETSASRLKEKARTLIESAPSARIDYIELLDAENLVPIETLEQLAVMAVAVEFGGVRLIDNLEF